MKEKQIEEKIYKKKTMLRLLKYNKGEMHILILGIISSILNGAIVIYFN